MQIKAPLHEENVGEERDKSVWGKRWNKRTVLGHLYKDRVEEQVENLVAERESPFKAYQQALTAVWESLTEREQKSCSEQAEAWNSGPWPRDLQIS